MGRGNVVLDVVREGTEMGGWWPAWWWDSARDTLLSHETQSLVQSRCLFALPLPGVQIGRRYSLWNMASWEGEAQSTVCCSHSSSSYRNRICIGGGNSSTRSSNSCCNKMMKEKYLSLWECFLFARHHFKCLKHLYVLNRLISQLSFEASIIFTCNLWLKKLE